VQGPTDHSFRAGFLLQTTLPGVSQRNPGCCLYGQPEAARLDRPPTQPSAPWKGSTTLSHLLQVPEGSSTQCRCHQPVRETGQPMSSAELHSKTRHFWVKRVEARPTRPCDLLHSCPVRRRAQQHAQHLPSARTGKQGGRRSTSQISWPGLAAKSNRASALAFRQNNRYFTCRTTRDKKSKLCHVQAQEARATRTVSVRMQNPSLFTGIFVQGKTWRPENLFH